MAPAQASTSPAQDRFTKANFKIQIIKIQENLTERNCIIVRVKEAIEQIGEK